MSFALSSEPCTALIIATNSEPRTSVRTCKLAGWVDSTRDHGGVIFIDLRDREGLTQVVFRPEEFPEVAASAHTLRSEDVVQIIGKVARRLEGTQNPKLATGEIEVVASIFKYPEPIRNICRFRSIQRSATKICGLPTAILTCADPRLSET